VNINHPFVTDFIRTMQPFFYRAKQVTCAARYCYLMSSVTCRVTCKLRRYTDFTDLNLY